MFWKDTHVLPSGAQVHEDIFEHFNAEARVFR